MLLCGVVILEVLMSASARPRSAEQIIRANPDLGRALDICFSREEWHKLKGQQSETSGNDLGGTLATSRQSDRPQSVESVNCEADHKTEGQSSDWSFPMWLRAIGLVGVGLMLFRLFK